ncbi:hypothetical protein BU26DRAFT_582813 [Trematosphaeria pertusa]|uniref:Uncharacterized protein n=1 Tax=Trematosphaeria pertusa TaxID=390896 RepID=A0A6A6IW78_9PLEO|nr:uncharacterized protein BU26DRAFT_582813 [Trematosphaeria pertusa]KAF2254327.1 hypothetical protein BU26DRAFT_582813 [Trematosphaeria pertusa]
MSPRQSASLQPNFPGPSSSRHAKKVMYRERQRSSSPDQSSNLAEFVVNITSFLKETLLKAIVDTSNENNKQLNESNNQMISQLRGIQDAIQSCDPNVTNALASPASYQDLLEFKRVVLQSLVNQNQSLLEMKTGQSMLDDKLRRLVTLVDEQLTALSQGAGTGPSLASVAADVEAVEKLLRRHRPGLEQLEKMSEFRRRLLHIEELAAPMATLETSIKTQFGSVHKKFSDMDGKMTDLERSVSDLANSHSAPATAPSQPPLNPETFATAVMENMRPAVTSMVHESMASFDWSRIQVPIPIPTPTTEKQPPTISDSEKDTQIADLSTHLASAQDEVATLKDGMAALQQDHASSRDLRRRSVVSHI